MTSTRLFDEFPDADAFRDRHVGPQDQDLQAMLAALGADDLDRFVADILPESIRLPHPLSLPAPCSEAAALDEERRPRRSSASSAR